LNETRPQASTSWSWDAAGEDSGQDLAEYAILTALIVLVVIGVLSLVGDRIAAFYESVVGVLPFGG
jgi:Flp pilus assembly pilin Flp